MNTLEAKLAAKVKAVNRAHAYVPELYGNLVEVFRPYVGQKIIKADGSLLAKINSQLPVLPLMGHALSVYRHRSDYSLAWTIKTCESTGDYGCLYYEATVYVGDLIGGVLSQLADAPLPVNYRTDYTVEEIAANREAVKVAEQAYNDAKGKLYIFGEYEN